MTSTPSPVATRTRRRFPLHWAWVVAGASLFVLVGSSGFRALPGVVMEPMHVELGWSRATISLAVAANLVMFGLTAPFSAALMERYGIRRVVTGAMLLMTLGSALPVFITQSWILLVAWGLLVGVGGGAVALAYVATLTNRWFVRHRGLVIGILTAGGTAGQLAFLPGTAWLADRFGWQTASLVVAGAALAAAPIAFYLVRDHPRDMGLRPYGAERLTPEQATASAPEEEAATKPAGALRTLQEVARTRAFWLLVAGFGICGVTTAGVVQTHFIPAAHDHGMPQTTAAGLLALAGLFDIVGTTLSGWLTDRVDSRLLLAIYYALRGLSLLFLPAIFAAELTPSMLVFIIFYGLDWIATVPPTIRLCQECFGSAAGVVFGWLWTAHQVGGAVAASAGGFIRDYFGSYTTAWYVAGLVCLVAAILSLRIPRPAGQPAAPAAAPA